MIKLKRLRFHGLAMWLSIAYELGVKPTNAIHCTK